MGKVLHASGSGYFPSCIQNGTGYWSLEKAMDIYWRVRTWEISLSVTYLITEGEGSQTLTTSPLQNPYELTAFVTEEEAIPCNINFFEIAGSGPGGDFRITFGTVKKGGSLYDPGFDFYATWGDEYDFGFAEFEVTSGDGGDDVRPFSIYGSNPIQMSFNVYERPEVSFTLLDATLSVEPKEWWSYGGTYNTSTGARL